MPYRWLCCLLIPLVLLPQFAAMPHTHGADHPGNEPHTSLPHFHLHLSPSPVHHPERESHPTGRPLADSAERGCPCDHDDDAVYVVETDGRSPERVAVACDDSAGIVPAMHSRAGSMMAIPLASRTTTGPPIPPDCPIYVRHLSLLI